MRSVDDAVFSPGDAILGKYRVERLLGRGGMGEVYLARNQFLDQPVAIKVLPLKRSGEEHWKERMRREAQAGARLAHENLVKVLDGGITDDNLVYIVMEYLDGAKSLRELVWHSRGFDLPDALAYAIQLLDGLAAVHAAGILHRDLKPENVVVLPGGQLKIIDFGLARVRTSAMRTTIVPEGQRMGTLHYMAPEQILGGEVGPPADVYATGLILHEMVAGRHVFQQETDLLPSVQEVSIMHQLAQPPRLDTRQPGVPKELADVVECMLAKDAAARPTALEAGAALERLLADVTRTDAARAAATRQGSRGTMMLPEGFVAQHPLGPFAPHEAVVTLCARAMERALGGMSPAAVDPASLGGDGAAQYRGFGVPARGVGAASPYGAHAHDAAAHGYGGAMGPGQGGAWSLPGMRGAPPPDLPSGLTPSPVATNATAPRTAHTRAAIAGVVCGVVIVGAALGGVAMMRGRDAGPAAEGTTPAEPAAVATGDAVAPVDATRGSAAPGEGSSARGDGATGEASSAVKNGAEDGPAPSASASAAAVPSGPTTVASTPSRGAAPPANGSPRPGAHSPARPRPGLPGSGL